ncbi:GumC family protein [Bacteroides faecium]|uniref:non-specific protein-tyrosine kinase n=1 Tax=Bacteroides faecium TaxID=2715212 RepID=A0A6H0KRK1_9BACE|nr:tyrosine-protein kinase [Bacteroides faecium]QIU95138.1 polysaccharide biosynthesis tyrosine autokinase [Bacteroides faecium]
MEYTQENNEKTVKESGFNINLRDIVELIIANWYWFALSVFICLSVAYLYTRTLVPVYQRQAVMLVKTGGKNANSDISAMLELQGGITGSGVENEMFILRSHQLVREVVNRLHLDVSYEKDGFFRNTSLYAESPVEVNFIDPYHAYYHTKVTPLDVKNYTILGEKYAYGDTIQTEAGRIVVNLKPENLSAYIGKPVSVTRISPETAAAIYKGGISTSLAGKGTTMVQITCTGDNISRADAILNALINVYNETIIEDKNRIAVNTAKFIDERIAVIGKELGDVEEELTDFKQRNRIIGSEGNGTQFLAESSRMKTETLQMETELSIAQSIKSYLLDATRNNQLIPNVSGVGDASVQSQITAYNELMLQRNHLLAESGAKNPVVQTTDKNLAEMRTVISGSMDNYIKNLHLRLEKARAVERQINSEIQAVPKQEKMALSIIRQQSIKEALYTFLLNKREENALQLAVTEANIRVVESPFGSNAPIAPHPTTFLLAAFVVGLAIPLGIQILIMLWNTSVRGRKDIEDYTTIPLLGEIPSRKEDMADDAIVVDDKKNDLISESFRLLRANINFVAKDVRVLMFTSTMPGEGKSFVSRNLAVAIAIAGKKVVLVDTDMRKRTQSKLAGIKHKDGLSTYLSGQHNDVDSILDKGLIHPSVDSLFVGPIPPNPSELLMSDRLEKLIEELKKRYDYIILDNVPAQVVADAAIVNRVAELTLYVIRDGQLDRRYLPELERLHKEGKFNHLCIVLNDSHIEKKKYGYGYAYGYGYGYGYKYGEYK